MESEQSTPAEESKEDENPSDSEEEHQKPSRHEQMKAKIETKTISKEEEQKARRDMLINSSQHQSQTCWKSVILNAFVALVFYAYFIFTYSYHKTQIESFQANIINIHLFYKKYTDF